MDGDGFNPVVIFGIVLIIAGLLVIAAGYLPRGLITVGIGAPILGVGGSGSTEGAGIIVSGSPGLVIIRIGVIAHFLTGRQL